MTITATTSAARRAGLPAVPALEQAELHSFLIAIRKVLERLEGIVGTLESQANTANAALTTSISDTDAALRSDLAATTAALGASLVGIEDSGALITATTVEGALAENRGAIDTLESGKATSSQKWEQSWLIQFPEDGDYRVVVDAEVARTITEVTTICTTGTATLTVKINTTALGGTANSVSTSEQAQSHSSSNSVAIGDDIVLTFSSTSSCENVSVKISGTLSLATS